MTPEYEQEIAANLERAEQSIQAAKDLAVKDYYDFAASRAYYAAFYGATAVLLNEGLDFRKVFTSAPHRKKLLKRYVKGFILQFKG